jgi:hypothetical protein
MSQGHDDPPHAVLPRRELLLAGGVLALAALASLTATAGAESSAPELKGWRRAGATAMYDRATVWQAINGAAELFVAYDFRSLREQAYETAKLKVTVQIYEQGSPLDGFGVFARERPPKGEVISAAAGGIYGGDAGHCLAYKGKHYVKVLAAKGTLDRASCAALLGALTRWLPGGDAPPSEVALLPLRGQLAGTLGYTRKSFLGTRRLNNCVHADYKQTKDGKPYTLFVVLPKPGQSPDAAWRELASQWTLARQGDLEVVSGQIPYRGIVVLARRGKMILGAIGAGDLKATVTLLRGLPR